MNFSSLYDGKAVLVPLLSALLWVGCDDGDSETDDASGSETQNTSLSGTTMDVQFPPGPLYAVVTQIFSADSQTSYALLTESLSAGVVLDTATAVEIPGRALGFGPPGENVLFVGGTDGPSIRRYAVAESQQLVLDAEISLIDRGVTSVGEYQGQVQFVSDVAAFYFDGGTAQAIVWNPSEMVVDGAISLAELSRPETVLTFSSSPVQVDQRIFMPAAWRSADNTTIIPESAMVVIDSATRLATVVRDTRCGYAREAVLGGDGYVYVATEAYGSAVHRVAPANAPAPCMLRFDVASGTYDPDFMVDLNTLTGSSAAGSIFPAGAGQAWIRTLDESLIAVDAEIHPRVLASASAWQWWRVMLGSPLTGSPAIELPPGNGSTFVWQVEGGTWIPEHAGDRSSTVFRNLDDGLAGASVPGLVFSMVQVR